MGQTVCLLRTQTITSSSFQVTAKWKSSTIRVHFVCGFAMMDAASLPAFWKREDAPITGVCKECGSALTVSARNLTFGAVQNLAPKLN